MKRTLRVGSIFIYEDYLEAEITVQKMTQAGKVKHVGKMVSGTISIEYEIPMEW